MLLSSLGPLGAVGGFIQVACASGRGIDVNNYAAITEFFFEIFRNKSKFFRFRNRYCASLIHFHGNCERSEEPI